MSERQVRVSELTRLASARMDAKVVAKKEAEKVQPPRASGKNSLSEPFDMPEGEVWIHPLSLGQQCWAVGEAAKLLRGREFQSQEEEDGYRNVYTLAFRAVAACHISDDPESDFIYSVDDGARFLEDPAYANRITAVYAISERLGSDDSTRRGFESFFDAILVPLEQLSLLPNSEDYWNSSQEVLTDLILRLRLTRQRGTLLLAESEEAQPEPSDLDTWKLVESPEYQQFSTPTPVN